MLDYFGDVATELAIRLDGDEALFRTYEHVDFLAPVHGGDYIEYVGWLEAVGNTSHRWSWKHIRSLSLLARKACLHLRRES